MLNPDSNPYHAEALELLEVYGTRNTEKLLQVHYTTVRRWRDGTVPVPRAVLLALRAAVHGRCPQMDSVKSWEGWSFSATGLLTSPEGDEFTAGDLRAQAYERQLLAHLQREVRELRERLLRELELANQGANDAVVGPLLSRPPVRATG